MDKDKNKNLQKQTGTLFDSIRHVDANGNEYWSARELGEALEYASWDGFKPVVARAKLSTAQSGIPVENHFRDVSKMVVVGYGNDRLINDYDVELTRHACYVIAQNGNAAKKPRIAEAQAYFAYQTERQEKSAQRESDIKRLIARHEFTESDKRFSGAVMEKGISARGLGTIKNEGDKQLYGGLSTKQMKKAYGITKERTPLANRLPNVILAGKTFANEMTAKKLEDLPINTFDDILEENNGNNAEVRSTLLSRGFIPEEMTPEEDTEKIMRRIVADDKKKALGESGVDS